MRVSRCLPRARVRIGTPPVRSTVASAGTRKSVVVSGCPVNARSRAAAARWTVAPSGTDPQPLGSGDEAGRREGRAQLRLAAAEQCGTVRPLHGEPPESATPGGLGERGGGRGEPVLVVAPGEEGAAA